MEKSNKHRKSILGIALILIITLETSCVVTSCDSTKQLSHAINKHGQKESAAFFVQNYPEYFLERQVYDTIYFHDSIKLSQHNYVGVIEASEMNSFLIESKPIQISNDSISLTLQETKTGAVNYTVITKPKKIPIDIIKPVKYNCPPCPEVGKLKDSFKNNKYTNWNYFILYSGYLFWLSLIIYLIVRIRRKK